MILNKSRFVLIDYMYSFTKGAQINFDSIDFYQIKLEIFTNGASNVK
jgi:hypothetical protein